MGIEFVLIRGNLGELPATLSWAASHGASFAIVTHMLPYDDMHRTEAAYDTCSDEARRQGLDIRGYFEARWKFRRNPEEQKLLDLVETMKREAEGRNIFIDMRKLLAMDTGIVQEVGEVFARAREVAAETGLDLRLPEITPKEKRLCNFIEEGGAFITWEGNVSPCYFLWHRYLCFASGWAQQVRPKVFGNLRERGVLDIWNDPSFRAFRKNVLAYDYPICSSCSLAPCDYVQADEFEQDCHIRDVPCGACLWGMGVFQCLR